MFGRNQVSDKDLLKQINQRLARTGTASQSKVNVSVQQGNVTLTGTLQHAIQRSPIVKAISRVAGVRRVNDQMQHTAKKAPRPEPIRNVHLPESTSVVESSNVTATMEEEPVELPALSADELPRPE
jgi:phosphoribosylformylglycinamidine (FGAM) synthase-like enzyme